MMRRKTEVAVRIRLCLLLIIGAQIGCGVTSGVPTPVPRVEAGTPAMRVATGGQTSTEAAPFQPEIYPLDSDAHRWVEETLTGFSLEELVGQLVMEWMPGGYTTPTSPDFEPLRRWVVENKVGGLLPSIGTPHAYVAKLNALQRIAEVPLLVGSDFENGGPGMRINGAYALPSMLPQGGGTQFPPTMAFGAIGDERFAYEYGRITALEARATGVHVLFAPVLDVNNNPENPVIASRSFGADPNLVGRLGAAFIRGARAGGAFTTGKHFPGHGDTSVDSHVGLPVIPAERSRLDALELVPFVQAIEEGVDAIMTAHVSLPGLLGEEAPPATLAPEVLTDLLRRDLRFEGLVFTDALTMRAITDSYGIGEASVRSLEAGADVILSPADVPAAIDAVVEAVQTGRIQRSRVESSVRRILEMKARLGLHRDRFTALDEVEAVVGSGPHLAFADSVASRAITLVRDDQSLLPMDASAPGRTVHLRYARTNWLWAGRAFSAGLLERVPEAVEVRLDQRSDSATYAGALAALEDADRVIVSVYLHPSAGSGEDALPQPFRELVSGSVGARPTVLISFRSPYLVQALPNVSSYMLAWGDREPSQRAAVRSLFGEEAISGRLPIPIPPLFQIGDGLERAKVTVRAETSVVENPLVAAGILPRSALVTGSGRQQSTADPASVGMSAERLAQLDKVVEAALADSAASGAVVAVGRRGRLVHLEAFGELAYGSGRPVTVNSIWDLASVSKVVGTTTAAMILVGDRRLNLDAPVVRYLPWWGRGDVRKERVTVRDLLLHKAGLPPFRRWFFEHSGLDVYKGLVADEPLESDPGAATVYSDIGVMTVAWVVEEVAGQRLDAFLAQRVWRPLGMSETRYRPRPELRPRIAATEMDTVWRGELVWGRVHDENADAMGGVAGHAGLFSTAVDLSVFASAMLTGGVASACVPGSEAGVPCPVRREREVRLVEQEVLDEFTRRYEEGSSRALGWDTPSGRSSAGDYFGAEAFGHTGYTGTSLWLEPTLDLWVVLLTNRVHPTRENGKHIPLRRAVHDAAALAIVDQAVPRRER